MVLNELGLVGSMRFNERDHLEIGGCDAVRLAEEYGTPLYVMDEGLLRENLRRYQEALRSSYPSSEVFYAGKAFLVMAMAKLVHEEGASLDVASGGEVYTAIKAGFPPERLCSHGNNKSREELRLALREGVGRIVVDNLPELYELLDLAGEPAGRKPTILFRLKPGVLPHTHAYIQTGQQDSKFGLGLQDEETWEAIKTALQASERVNLAGFHCHIGSQILQAEPFALAASVMVAFMAEVREKTGFAATELNLGGGLGISYAEEDKPPPIEDFVQKITSAVKDAAGEHSFPLPRIMLEPGRSICGKAGITLYRIGSIKDIPGVRRYVSIDGGMADNIRPALYQAVYNVALANRRGEGPQELVTIAGKACESGDILVRDASLPRVERGDLLTVFDTGAYCYAMASNYNRLPRPGVLFVRDGEARVVVKRETYEDLISHDQI